MKCWMGPHVVSMVIGSDVASPYPLNGQPQSVQCQLPSATKVSGASEKCCPQAFMTLCWFLCPVGSGLVCQSMQGRVLRQEVALISSQPVGVTADAVFCPLLGSCPPALFLHPLAAGLRCTLGNKVGAEPTGRTGPEGPPPQITDLKGGSRRVIRGNTSLGPRHAPAGSGPQLFWSPSSRGGSQQGEPEWVSGVRRVGWQGWGMVVAG